MGRAQSQIVDQHEESASGGVLTGKGEGREGGEDEVDQCEKEEEGWSLFRH